MPTEIEAKLRVDDHDAVRRRLERLGGTRLSRVVEANHILDRPDGSLRAQGCALRVRAFRVLEGRPHRSRMAYKGPRRPSGYKSREETEVEIEDHRSCLAILESVGFAVSLFFEKRRESWRVEDCLVELDELPYLGRFVEIEGPSEASITGLLQRLELDRSHLESAGYARLLSNYCAEHRVDPRAVRFHQTESATPRRD